MSKSKALAWPANVLSNSLAGPSGRVASPSISLNHCWKCSRSGRTGSMDTIMAPELPKRVSRSFSTSTLCPAANMSASLGNASVPQHLTRTEHIVTSRSHSNNQLDTHAFTTKPRHTQKNPLSANRKSAQSPGVLVRVLAAFADAKIPPAPSVTLSPSSPRLSGVQDVSLENFQLLVHAKHPAAHSVRSESLSFHRELQAIHRSPSTIVPPLSVLHHLYSSITRRQLLAHLAGSDWNMFIFWLSYHRDQAMLAQLHSQLLGANPNLSKNFVISESSREILIDSQQPSKPHGQDPNSCGQSTLTRRISTDISTDKTKQPSTSTATTIKSPQTSSRTKGAKWAHQGSSKSSPLSKDMDTAPFDNGSTATIARKKMVPLDFNSAMVDFKSALEEERTPSIEAANVLLRGLIRESRYEESVSFFHTLTEHHGLKPNADTYRSLIKLTSAYGQLAMTQRLISALKGLGVKRDAELCRDLMRCYIRSRNLTGAINVFENMDRIGIRKDIHHINILLEGATGGDSASPAPHLPPSVASSTANSPIKVSPLTAVGVLEIMASLKLRPNARTWYHLLSGAIQARDRVLAQHMFLELSREVASQKGPQRVPHSVDSSAAGPTTTFMPNPTVSLPVIGYASRHPDTFQLLVEEYARKYGAEPAARLLRGALDAGYPSHTTPSLQRMHSYLADQKS
ncbi:MAG: hypothetical protein BYD32DRAFT_189364 [Podila humilis]|nr:MAG: hypothetical protein BYD32DRAFT_189364 [Podila humilis]